MKLDLNNIEDSLSKFLQNAKELKKIINPVLEQYKLENKEVVEVCQIGKFLYNLNPDVKIIDKPKPPNPDFLLQLNNCTIGLEHTRIINSEKSRKYYSIETLLNNAASLFKTKYPKLKISATFRIKNDELAYSKSEKNSLTKKICEFVFEALNSDLSNQPDFISEIRIMPNSIVSFTFLENNFRGEKLTIEKLMKSIQNKEDKLKKYYSQNETIREFWLVLMIGSLSSASFVLDSEIDYKSNSTFDKVFLVEDFYENIIKIK